MITEWVQEAQRELFFPLLRLGLKEKLTDGCLGHIISS